MGKDQVIARRGCSPRPCDGQKLESNATMPLPELQHLLMGCTTEFNSSKAKCTFPNGSILKSLLPALQRKWNSSILKFNSSHQMLQKFKGRRPSFDPAESRYSEMLCVAVNVSWTLLIF